MATTSNPRKRKRSFTLKLADLGTSRWQGLPEAGMGGWAEHSGDPGSIYRPGLLDAAFGERCDFGALFTYLFRRFGLPNLPSDPYKDIADFALTTPLPDMIMLASPSVSGMPRLSLRFLVTDQTWCQLEVEPRQRWRRNLVAWRQAQGDLPEWMGEWLEFWRTKPGVGRVAKGDLSDWGLSLEDMRYVRWSMEEGNQSPDMPADQLALMKSVATFVDSLWEAYEAIEPDPSCLERAVDWNQWSDEDPLKPYYAAAAQALADLSTPVRVRDESINAHGVVSGGRLEAGTCKEPEVAGYGFGAFLNKHPKAAIGLLVEARKLGNGNLELGAQKLLAAAAAVEPKA